jgi:3-oxoacyl-[acyl-carrier protein] reductase
MPRSAAGTLVVTGGSRGIGRAFVVRAAERGYDVVFNYRDQAAEASRTVEIASKSGRAVHMMRADLASPEDVVTFGRFALEHGPVTALINNAAVVHRVHLVDVSEQDWAESVAVNLTAPMFLTQHLRDDLERHCGAILNVSSVGGVAGAVSSLTYGTSKAGLIGFTKSIARELAPHIRVNALAPGATDTQMHATSASDKRQLVEWGALLGRVATTDEIAQAGLDILGWTACTGQTIVVDCGRIL